jgi:hypothetical protein
MMASPPTSQNWKKQTLVHSFGEPPLMQQLYGNIFADAPCVCGVIHGPVVAGFFLGKSLGSKMAISDVQIMAIIHREVYPKSGNKLDMKCRSFISLL